MATRSDPALSPPPAGDASSLAAAWRSLVEGRWNRVLALTLTVLAVAFHGLFLAKVGALWRDEAAFVRLATLPTWREIWAMLAFDHCPLLPVALLRAWCACGLGGTDFGLRLAGAGAGLLVVGSLWIASRTLAARAPVVALMLVAVNVPFIRATDSIRGYGLGAALGILTLAAFWGLVRRPGWPGAAVAAVVSIACVQTLYQGAVFVLAAGCGAMLVCALRRDWRAAGLAAGAGAAAALSVVPYVPLVLKAQSSYVLVKSGFLPSTGWSKISAATGFPWDGCIWIWLGLVAIVLGAVLGLLRRRAQGTPLTHDGEVLVYAGTALVVGVGGFIGFLAAARFYTQVWYYAPLLAYAAACLDAAVPRLHRNMPGLLFLGGLAMALGAAAKAPEPLARRQTNIDAVAALLSREAAPTDFIVIVLWQYGISFDRYYHGAAPWETLPAISDHRFHRYDLAKAEMQRDRPIDPVLARAAATLRAGGRVWVVGRLTFADTPPQPLPPAPRAASGWFDVPYTDAWTAQAGYFLNVHSLQNLLVAGPNPRQPMPLEWVLLMQFSGWRAAPDP